MHPGGLAQLLPREAAAHSSCFQPLPDSRWPGQIQLDADGNLWTVEYGGTAGSRVLRFAPDGSLAASWGTSGRSPGDLITPSGIALRGDWIYVSDVNNGWVNAYHTWGRAYSPLAVRNSAP